LGGSGQTVQSAQSPVGRRVRSCSSHSRSSQSSRESPQSQSTVVASVAAAVSNGQSQSRSAERRQRRGWGDAEAEGTPPSCGRVWWLAGLWDEDEDEDEDEGPWRTGALGTAGRGCPMLSAARGLLADRGAAGCFSVAEWPCVELHSAHITKMYIYGSKYYHYHTAHQKVVYYPTPHFCTAPPPLRLRDSSNSFSFATSNSSSSFTIRVRPTARPRPPRPPAPPHPAAPSPCRPWCKTPRHAPAGPSRPP
jgi:hypothetical protein